MIVFFTLLGAAMASETDYQCKEENWKYQKMLTKTRSGIPCQRWDTQYPHQHSFTDASFFPDQTIADAGNFCRNPDKEIYAWCYTTSEVRWEFCDIIKCTDEYTLKCAENNWQYQKTLTETHSGIPCQRWDSQSPHTHSFTSDSDFPEETIGDAGNFCRNPNNDLHAWCYTTDQNRLWDYCDILYCTDVSENATEIGPERLDTTVTTTEMTARHSDKGQEETSYTTEMDPEWQVTTATTSEIPTMHSDKGQKGGAEVLVPNFAVISASFVAMMSLSL